MTDAQKCERAAKHIAGRTIFVRVGLSRVNRLPFAIELVADAPCFPAPGVRGGLSSSYHIGNTRTKDAAIRRAEGVEKSLRRIQQRIEVVT